MKETGIVRGIDSLGRIVLPKEMRRCMGINQGDELEIYVDDDKIVLKKYAPTCLFCGNEDHLVSYADKLVCTECLAKLKELG